MRTLVILFSLLLTQQFSFAQETVRFYTSANDASIVGRWDVAFVENSSKVSKDLFYETRNRNVDPLGNSNIAVWTFGSDGTFELISLQDYGASTETGTFFLSEDGESVTRTVSYPNQLKDASKAKVKRFTTKIKVISKDVLVIRTKKGMLYMRRTK